LLTRGSKLSLTKFFAWLIGFYIALSFVQRGVYIVWILLGKGPHPERLPQALGKGLLFDLAEAFFLFAPALLFCSLIPKRFGNRLWFKAPLLFLTFIPMTLACGSAVCELFFFDEFHSRFNFIAVDYLIYTTEVVHNIVESYSATVILGGLVLPLVILLITLCFMVMRLDRSLRSGFPALVRFSIVGLAALACAIGISEDGLLAKEAYWPREISKNSIFALFSAYRRNSINYRDFYTSIDSGEAFALTREWMTRKDQRTLGNEKQGLSREIKGTGAEKHWNVVMVVMESMSANFLQHFGNAKGITPNLDRMADEGLLFTSLYATGTRTVRGLEALMLSVPPTPGQSILRRPGSDHLANLGSVFSEHGYKTQFIYGGYGYFDNMKEWFEGNGFEVVDRASFPSQEVHFGNAWGVCDEDLFSQTLKQQDEIHAAGHPFFQVIMTTSNHRPYTYPDGKIDIPSHSGRDGAVKYSDYAIGQFIAESKKKPWFKDTLFIFVADHDASVAGGTDIPVRDYLIPAIIYNPNLIPAQKITGLTSQIDLAPSLLGLLNFSYSSPFFGQDVVHGQEGGRALLATYQKVALLQPHSLTILSPGRTIETQQLDDNFLPQKTSSVVAQSAATLPVAAKLTIAIYQAASDEFINGLLKVKSEGDSSNPSAQSHK
jgi:phosphoglycerol transferase MdoB-like AlkP superfamily enzyme